LDRKKLTASQYKEGILKNDRIVLAKAITLVESFLPADREIASTLIDSLLPYTGNSVRIGVTGVPGVGKSTFIESFGNLITQEEKKIAILTIDPSSQITHGSILGDKTRMDELSKNKLAFIRPTASGSALGGVANTTRQSILLCEAAGFEVIVVETVGVGQSEVAVKNMVDFFLLLMLAGAGDELQGIKKGIMEMADAVVITKADGDNLKHATEAQAEYQHALHYHSVSQSGWVPRVLTCSAFDKKGIDQVWATITDYINKTKTTGFFDNNRKQQNILWFREFFQQLLANDFLSNEKLKIQSTSLESEISYHKIAPDHAARKLLEAYRQSIKES
jgi:LAO/AO transport system kinase